MPRHRFLQIREHLNLQFPICSVLLLILRCFYASEILVHQATHCKLVHVLWITHLILIRALTVSVGQRALRSTATISAYSDDGFFFRAPAAGVVEDRFVPRGAMALSADRAQRWPLLHHRGWAKRLNENDDAIRMVLSHSQATEPLVQASLLSVSFKNPV